MKLMKLISSALSKGLKAVYAGIGALLAGLGTALVGAQTFNGISDAQWITIASLALASLGAVYGVTNASSGNQPAAK